MTTQLALDFGEDARAARRPTRPSVPAAAGLRALKTLPRRSTAARDTSARSIGSRSTGRKGAPEYWRLDEQTRAIGFKGVEEARRILAGISSGHAA
jgi:hypothetical protein